MNVYIQYTYTFTFFSFSVLFLFYCSLVFVWRIAELCIESGSDVHIVQSTHQDLHKSNKSAKLRDALRECVPRAIPVNVNR